MKKQSEQPIVYVSLEQLVKARRWKVLERAFSKLKKENNIDLFDIEKLEFKEEKYEDQDCLKITYKK